MKNAFNLVSQQALKMITEIPINQPTNKQKQGKNPTILETNQQNYRDDQILS